MSDDGMQAAGSTSAVGGFASPRRSEEERLRAALQAAHTAKAGFKEVRTALFLAAQTQGETHFSAQWTEVINMLDSRIKSARDEQQRVQSMLEQRDIHHRDGLIAQRLRAPATPGGAAPPQAFTQELPSTAFGERPHFMSEYTHEPDDTQGLVAIFDQHQGDDDDRT